MSGVKDLTGEKFGELIVLYRGENTTDGKSRWVCKCSCGNTKLVTAAHLRSGATKSCGCLKEFDLTGQKFGRLVVMCRVASRNGASYYHCKCSCGNEIDVRGTNLSYGTTKSCGCLNDEVRHLQHKFNDYRVLGDTVIMYTDGGSFLIDTEDLDIVRNYYWTENKQGYIVTSRNGTVISLHRLVMKYDGELFVDHKSGNTTDNRKSNLRVCTIAENARNRAKIPNTTGYTGVYLEPDGMYRARITYEGKRINLGRFADINDAIVTREVAEDKYFGEFSRRKSRD